MEDGVANNVRLTGQNLGNVIINKWRSLNLDFRKCAGQGARVALFLLKLTLGYASQ